MFQICHICLKHHVKLIQCMLRGEGCGAVQCIKDGRGKIGLKNHVPTVQIAVPASNDYINIVRLTVFGMASKIGFSYEEIEDLKIAVSEAFSSSVNQHDEDDKIVVGLDRQLDALRISIK